MAIILSMIGLASQTAHPRVSVIGRKRGADVLRPLSPEHRPEKEAALGEDGVSYAGRLTRNAIETRARTRSARWPRPNDAARGAEEVESEKALK